MQTAHHAAVFYVGPFPLAGIFQYTNHLAVSCFEYSGYSLLWSQLTVRPRSSLHPYSLSSVLFEIFRNLSYFKTKGYLGFWALACCI